ncbi:MAG: adenosylcobinamide-phosphate synthase CbiB [Rikenellaceae bacterium]
MEINIALLVITIGFLLDTLIGDPYWMPHPIRVFGNMISFMERHLNSGRHRGFKGFFMWVILCGAVVLLFGVADHLLSVNNYIYVSWSAVLFFYALSNRCLIEEGLKVERVLQSGDLEGARKQLSMIVGRQTAHLTPSQIRSAVIETLSENLSDGVVAPLFYYAIGGIPLMMTYKMINTLDSMVGYKNDRYMQFGCFSAKMDDVANFIPARLTALLMVVASMSLRAVKHIFKYGRSHSSPNSGYPESALSGVLDCRLGGPNQYFGKIVDKPYIGDNERDITHRDVIRCTILNAKVAALCFVLLVAYFYFSNVGVQ